MRLANEDEARAVHELYESLVETMSLTKLDHQLIVSVLLKITASLALSEEWDREELLQAFAYTYEMEKFLTPVSKERH
jgi:hypothetical protein